MKRNLQAGRVALSLGAVTLSVLLAAVNLPAVAVNAEPEAPVHEAPLATSTEEPTPVTDVNEGDSAETTEVPVEENSSTAEETVTEPNTEDAVEATESQVTGDETEEPAESGASFRSTPPRDVRVNRGAVYIRVKTGGDRPRLDAPPTGVPGAVLGLYRGRTEVARCTADANGYCDFKNLTRITAGDYVIRGISAPAGWRLQQQVTVEGSEASAYKCGLFDLDLCPNPIQETRINYEMPLTIPQINRFSGTYLESGIDFARPKTDAEIGPTSVAGGTGIWPRYGKNSSGYFMLVRENPQLPVDKCSLNVAFLMDTTRSMYWRAPVGAGVGTVVEPKTKYLNEETQAITKLVTALKGTKSTFALFPFGPDAPNPNMYEGSKLGLTAYPGPISLETNAGVNQAIRTYAADSAGQVTRYTPPRTNSTRPWEEAIDFGNVTNYDRSLFRVKEAAPKYDLVFFITDGEPNIYNNRKGSSDYISLRSVEEGVFSANALKAEGTRVVVIAAGGANSLRVPNLESVSGTRVANSRSKLMGDYFQVNGYAEMGNLLRELVETRCHSGVEVFKKVVPVTAPEGSVDGATAAEGWEFGGALTNNQATFSKPTAGATASGVTDADGRVSFRIELPTNTTTTSIDIKETQKPGYELVQRGVYNAECREVGSDRIIHVGNFNNPANPGIRLDGLRPDTGYTCTFYNKPVKGRNVVLLKHVEDNGIGGSGLANHWILKLTSVDGATEIARATGSETKNASNTFQNVAVGTYKLVETDNIPGYVQVRVQRLRNPEGTIDHNQPALWEDVDPNAVNIGASNEVFRFVNSPKPGKLTFEKVDKRYTQINLPGSTWELKRTAANGKVSYITDPGVKHIVDCVTTDARNCMGQDKDPGAGKFSLEGLPWGSYELKELNPPAGYIASTTVYKFTVNNQKQEGFALAGTRGNKITNEINETPRLPLTGGYGIYLPIGLGMLLMLVGARRLQVQNS